jgi:hypothetical protein
MKVTINYAQDRGDGIVSFLLDRHWSGATRVQATVDIADGRPIAGSLSLDRQGFILDRIVSGVTDYGDRSQLEALWAPAAAELVKRATGAKWAISWALNTRFSDGSDLSTSTPVAAPARVTHSDFRPDFDPANVGEEPFSAAAATEMERRLGSRTPKRWRAFNVWQQISPPPQDTPLALCDSSSVAPDDVLNGEGHISADDEKVIGLAFYRHNPAHRWYYFSEMLPGEALIFSGFDPAAGPVYRRVPHVAFDLPNPPTNAVYRNSVEVRVVAVFEE